MTKRIFQLTPLFVLLMGLLFTGMAESFDLPEDPPNREQREKVRKRIETLRMWKLTEALDLDEETSTRLFPLLKRYDKKRAQIQRKVQENMTDLRDALRNNRDDRLQTIIAELEQNHTELQRTKEEERAELKRILSVKQQAKLLIFQVEFNKEIRKLIAETRKRRFEERRRFRE